MGGGGNDRQNVLYAQTRQQEVDIQSGTSASWYEAEHEPGTHVQTNDRTNSGYYRFRSNTDVREDRQSFGSQRGRGLADLAFVMAWCPQMFARTGPTMLFSNLDSILLPVPGLRVSLFYCLERYVITRLIHFFTDTFY